MPPRVSTSDRPSTSSRRYPTSVVDNPDVGVSYEDHEAESTGNNAIEHRLELLLNRRMNDLTADLAFARRETAASSESMQSLQQDMQHDFDEVKELVETSNQRQEKLEQEVEKTKQSVERIEEEVVEIRGDIKAILELLQTAALSQSAAVLGDLPTLESEVPGSPPSSLRPDYWPLSPPVAQPVPPVAQKFNLLVELSLNGKYGFKVDLFYPQQLDEEKWFELVCHSPRTETSFRESNTLCCRLQLNCEPKSRGLVYQNPRKFPEAYNTEDAFLVVRLWPTISWVDIYFIENMKKWSTRSSLSINYYVVLGKIQNADMLHTLLTTASEISSPGGYLISPLPWKWTRITS